MAEAEDEAPPAPSSRLCVKNIPKYVDEKRLREYFSAKGDVTDVKILRTKDGKSRCFGFVGLKSAEQAAAAAKYFHLAFMDTCRLEIQFAESFMSRSPAATRPWSKYSAGSSASAAASTASEKWTDGPAGAQAGVAAVIKKGKKARAQPAAAAEDPQLLEFLSLMKARSTVKSYANDELLPESTAAVKPAQQRRGRPLPPGADDDDEDDDEDYQDLTAVAPVRHASSKERLRAAGGSNAGEDARRASEASKQGAGDGGAGSARKRSAGSAGAGASADDADGDEDGDEEPDEAIMNDDISDLEYLRSRMRASLDAADDDEEIVDADRGDDEDAAEDAEEADAADAATSDEDVDGEHADADEEGQGAEADADARSVPGESSGRGAFSEDPAALIQQTGRIFVRNLPYVATDEELTAAFAPFGALTDVHVARDKATGASKGFAHVQFAAPGDAVAAFRALDGSIFQGRLLHLLPGKRPVAAEAAEAAAAAADGAAGAASFKAQREAARKADAGNRSAWSTLYMRQDTVAEAVAAVLGIDKSELLDPEASDVAVRLALGETQVVALTKQGLEEAGVNIAALEAAAAASGKAAETTLVQRSRRVLLLKNLPYSADAGELSALFEKFGGVARLILPETRTMAVVELEDDEAARRAFKGLAYKRYHHVPIYLEWAPADIFDASSGKGASKAGAAKGAARQGAAAPADARAAGVNSRAAAVLTGLAEAETADTDSVTLYVKNLSFSTTEEQLRAHFDKAASAAGGALRSAHISTAKRGTDKVVSRGFGFVELSDRDTAKAVIRALQGSLLDAHKLELQISAAKAPRSTAAKAAKDKGLSDTKLLVKNLAFEATAKDVRALLEAFGHVKTCRLPQKFDGSKRGFAFVEFGTKGEAKRAVESVQGTHLYGRRLLLEYAKEEEGLDELRAKTAAKFSDGPVSKKRRKTETGLGYEEASD